MRDSGKAREQAVSAEDHSKDTGLYTMVIGRARKSRLELLKNLSPVIREYWIAVTEYRTGRKGRREASQGGMQQASPSKQGRCLTSLTAFPIC